MSDDDFTPEAIELVAWRLARVKPARAHDLRSEVAFRISRGQPRSEVNHWYLVSLVMELHAVDSSIFGSVSDDDTTRAPHPGGRPPLMREEEHRRFVKFMGDASGTVQARVSAFIRENAWCNLSPHQLEKRWFNQNRKRKPPLKLYEIK